MNLTYEGRLNPSTRREILVKRQLDLTDKTQREVGKIWIKEK
ncbi:MAG: hypothetical protein ABIH28_01940 [archaeon]